MAAETSTPVKKNSIPLSQVFPRDPALVKALGKANLKTRDDLLEAKLVDLLQAHGLGMTRLTRIVRRLYEIG